MKTRALSLLVMGLALMSSACSFNTVGSDEVPADSIYQYYSVAYSASSNKTNANAAFHVKKSYGDYVELLYPSYVLVNNAPMNHSSFLGSRYDRDFSGYVQAVEFKYVDKDGKLWINKAEIYPISLKTYNAHLNLGGPYQVTVEAPNLRSGESLDATLCQYEGGGSVCAYAKNSGGTLKFTVSEIAKLKTGISATLKVTRSHSQRADGPKGGVVHTSYSSQEIYVQIH